MSLYLIACSLLTVLFIGILLFNARLRRSLQAPREAIQKSLALHGIQGQNIHFPTLRGRSLHGWFLPAQAQGAALDKHTTIIICHGWGSNREHMLPLARPLQSAGFNILLFDARNHGTSDADNFSSMPRFAEDIAAAIQWRKAQTLNAVVAERLVLIGHSVGAAASLLAASRRVDQGDIAAVISLSAFAHPDGMMRRWLHDKGLPFFPLGWYVLNYVQWVIGNRFDAIAPVNTIRAITCPVLLVHSRDDTVVPLSDAEMIYAQRRSDDVILYVLPGGHDATEHIETHSDMLIRFIEHSFD